LLLCALKFQSLAHLVAAEADVWRVADTTTLSYVLGVFHKLSYTRASGHLAIRKTRRPLENPPFFQPSPPYPLSSPSLNPATEFQVKWS